MRIKKLTFGNINSLAGAWEIDFDDPAFGGGIFILTGPTGAGKTSILDAICLALYGETSRQKSFTSRENEVMTKGTARCFSQVEFESRGRLYRSLWEHRRKKGDEFQNRVSRKILEITEGREEIVAESIRDADREIEAILKMNFKQFTSAVLLPQGKFDEFLTADKKVRSDILEKITGAQVYSRIGSAVQKRKNEEDRALDTLRERANMIRPFGEEEERALEKSIAGHKELAARKEEEVKTHNQRLELCRLYEKLKAGIEALEKNTARLREEKQARAEDFENLEKAKKAAALFPAVSAYEQHQKEMKAVEAETEAIEKNLSAINRDAAELAVRRAAAEAAEETARETARTVQPVLQRARELFIELHLNQNRVKDYERLSSALSYDNARKKLKDGEPCPLCGSVDHPFCSGKTPGQRRQDDAIAPELEALRKTTEAVSLELRELFKKLPGARETGAETGAETAPNQAAPNQAAPNQAALNRYETEINAALEKAKTECAELATKAEVLAASRGVHEKNLAGKAEQKKQTSAQLNESRAKTEAAFAENGFGGLDEWKRCYWETARIALTEQKKAELATMIAAGEASLAAQKEELAEMSAFPEGESERIDGELRKLMSEIRQLSETAGENANKLEDNKNKKRQKAELEKDIAGQEATCRDWKRMDDWIGGTNGYRFKQFAQIITFRQLVHSSRPYLLQMSAGRYELRAKDDEELLLPVVTDCHQGFIERVITNLSGGERFLLSLALALGLSKLSGKNLQIDSLFLDEGFGSLDKETLELAITILGGLKHNQGKLTGIISHVEELRERIGAVIQVTKTGGGRSVISGCGARQLQL